MASLLYNRRSESFLPTQQLVRTRPAVFGGDSDYVDSLVSSFLSRLGCAQLAVFAVALPVLTILTLTGGTHLARGRGEPSNSCRFVAPRQLLPIGHPGVWHMPPVRPGWLVLLCSMDEYTRSLTVAYNRTLQLSWNRTAISCRLC